MAIGYKPNPANNIPNQASDYASWIEWHKELKSRYGLKQANALFIKAWAKRKPVGLLDSLNVLNRKRFIDYFKENGISIDQSSADEIVGFTSSIFDEIGNVLQFGKAISIILVIFVLIIIGAIVWSILKNPSAYAQTATAVATRGAI